MNKSIFCFGKVQWDKYDLLVALKQNNIPLTDKNAEKLYRAIDEDWLIERMVEAGWEYIHKTIEMEGGWDE